MVDAREYHERTNHTPERLRSTSHTPNERNRPRPFKTYRECPMVTLDAIAPPAQPTLSAIAAVDGFDGGAGQPHSLDREAVATLAYLAAGITQETEYKGERARFRAASCTGNLHHIDGYVVCGDVAGLDAGVYHFDPTAFSLDVLRTGDYRGTLNDAAGGHDAAVPLWVVITSTWWRNAWKYRERTYRHAFWDGGTVTANLLATAAGLDLPAEVVSAFADDQVADLIGVDPPAEAPITMVAIGESDPADRVEQPATIDPKVASLSPDREPYPLIHDAWRQSTLADGAAARAWRADCRSAGAIGHAAAGDGRQIDLDPVDDTVASARPLLETVKRRGSKRRFAETGPSRRKLGTVLDRATRGVPGDWSASPPEGPRFIDCYVLTADVEGVPDGRYQFHPHTGSLERLGDNSREVMTRLALNQEWAGEAHANVYLMADIDAIVETLGNRGYRLAQFEAGITLGRLYLAASAHRDLGGTGLTFFDQAVSEHFSPRSASQTPMTLFAFGTVDQSARPRL